MSETRIEIKTAHFEGSHTSHDWQPYDVEILERGAMVTLRCNRLIEGRTRRSDGTYRIRQDSVRFSDDAALRTN